MNGTLETGVRDFIRDKFLFGAGGDELTADYSFLAHGVLDSMGVIELVHFLEERCGISIDDTEIVPENLDSIGQISAFVTRKQGA